MQKNDIIEVEIDDNALDGAGVSHYSGYSIFIKGAIKGEKVRAKIICVKTKICFAITEKILRTSKHRISAPCPYYLKCGGCSMQHIEYDEQLKIKTSMLKTTLQKQGIAAEVGLCVPSYNIYNYRNKLSLPVRGNPPKIGFFYKNSHNIIEIKDCLLQNFDCAKLIKIIEKFMAEFSLSGYDEATSNGDIRHVVARSISGLIIVVIVVNRPLHGQLKALNAMLLDEYGNSYALYSNLNTKNNNVIFSNDFKFIGGNNDKTEYCGTHTTIHPAAFFQVNDNIRGKIYSKIISHIENLKNSKEERIIIDAYAGAGILGMSLCGYAQKVYSVEINKEAHESAVELKRAGGVQNLECVLDDCAKALPLITQKENGKNITVVLDPPRAGADEKVLSAILSSSVDNVIYVSCNPATLARDLKILIQKFNIESITPYDMFPQTDALETLAVLSKI